MSKKANPSSMELAPSVAIVRKVKNVAKASAFPPPFLCIVVIAKVVRSVRLATITKTNRAFVQRAKPANILATASKVSDVSTDFALLRARQPTVVSGSAVCPEKPVSP
jgi:hypothetical protein